MSVHGEGIRLGSNYSAANSYTSPSDAKKKQNKTNPTTETSMRGGRSGREWRTEETADTVSKREKQWPQGQHLLLWGHGSKSQKAGQVPGQEAEVHCKNKPCGPKHFLERAHSSVPAVTRPSQQKLSLRDPGPSWD